MIKEYKKKDGSKAYMFVAYLGVDPLTEKQKRTTRRGFKTKRDAKIAEARLLAEVQENGLSINNKITFKTLSELWLEQYKLQVKESTYMERQKILRLVFYPQLENVRIDKLNVRILQRIVNETATKYVNYRNYFAVLGLIFKFAINQGYMKENLLTRVTYPKAKVSEKPIDRFYDKEELKHFFDRIKTEPFEIQLMFRLLAFTGVRSSECLAVTWGDIDFSTSMLSINKTLAKGLNDTIIILEPKTKNSKRTISLDKTTLEMLKKHKLECTKHFFADGYKLTSNDYVFIDEKCTHHKLHYIASHLNTIYRKHADLKVISPHGFRHSHCSLLFESGATLKEVQVRLGHNDIKTTLNIYTHITKNSQDKAINNFVKYVNF